MIFFILKNRTIRSVEEHIKDSLLKEIMSMKSSKGLQIDLSSLEIKRTLDAEVLNSASFVRERVRDLTNHFLLCYMLNNSNLSSNFAGNDTHIDHV